MAKLCGIMFVSNVIIIIMHTSVAVLAQVICGKCVLVATRIYNIMSKAMVGSGTSVAAALKASLQNIVPQIEKIIEACKKKTAGIMQPSVDKIVKLCLDSGFAFKRNILGRNCGVHPENRARTGVDPFNAQNLCLKISKQGYSETKLENPMGFEAALEGANRVEQEALMKTFRGVRRLS